MAQQQAPQRIQLPKPRFDSDVSVEEALIQRRSVRQYSQTPMSLAEISQLLWAAQGITHERGFRTAPSAGALYPLEVYLAAGSVDQLAAGLYRFNPAGHALLQMMEGDVREEIFKAALRQGSILKAPAVMVIAAVYERVTGKYGERGVRYVHMEAGHAAQNVFLQAAALDVKTVVIGAFRDRQLKEALHLEKDVEALYIMPLGK